MTDNKAASPREELARIIDPRAWRRRALALKGAEKQRARKRDEMPSFEKRDIEREARWFEAQGQREVASSLKRANEWLSRHPVKAASPEREAVAVWEALKRRCASTKPGMPEWDEVTTLVQVRRSDIEAVLSLPVQSVEGDTVGAAEREVGRYVYMRVEAFMAADANSPAGRELNYLAQLVSDVEEYGADLMTPGDLQPMPQFETPHPKPSEAPTYDIDSFADIYAKPVEAPAMGWKLIPVEPTDKLLLSMAIRYDHGLGVPGYYDQPVFGGENIGHEARLRAALITMRQLHEEVVGAGFYTAASTPESARDQYAGAGKMIPESAGQGRKVANSGLDARDLHHLHGEANKEIEGEASTKASVYKGALRRLLADHSRLCAGLRPQPGLGEREFDEDMVERAAREFSGAPFPSHRSIARARAALTAALSTTTSTKGE